MTGPNQIMIGAASMFIARWGKHWPGKVTCVMFGTNATSTESNALRQSTYFETLLNCRKLGMPVPKYAVAFLYTNTHWMVAIHNGDSFIALDGLDKFNTCDISKHIVAEALQHLVDLGFPKVEITYPKLWSQVDSFSCGWHCLHALRKFVFTNTHDVMRYKAPVTVDWEPFCTELQQLADIVYKVHGVPLVADTTNNCRIFYNLLGLLKKGSLTRNVVLVWFKMTQYIPIMSKHPI